jgi:hypothetical protein
VVIRLAYLTAGFSCDQLNCTVKTKSRSEESFFMFQCLFLDKINVREMDEESRTVNGFIKTLNDFNQRYAKIMVG